MVDAGALLLTGRQLVQRPFEIGGQGVNLVHDALARQPPELVVRDVPREADPAVERAPATPVVDAVEDRRDDALEGVLADALGG